MNPDTEVADGASTTADEHLARPRHRRFLVPVLAIAVLIVAGTWWWTAGADERRIDHACDTWLGQRAVLRSALSETDEAVGRAQAARAGETASFFNDVDETIGVLDSWERSSPEVVDRLHASSGSSIERSAVTAFTAVQEGVKQLKGLIDSGTPEEVSSWNTEMRARFQLVDDTCLAAARAI